MKIHYLEIVTREVGAVRAAYASALRVQFGEPDTRLVDDIDAARVDIARCRSTIAGRVRGQAVSTFDDVTTDELAAAPLKFIDHLHDRLDRAPAETRLM